MDRNTILAILLSVVVWLGYFYFFPPEETQKTNQKQNITQNKHTKNNAAGPKKSTPNQKSQNKTTPQHTTQTGQQQNQTQQIIQPDKQWAKNLDPKKTITVETKYYIAEISANRGEIISFRYKKYKTNKGQPVQLVIQNDKYSGPKSWPFGIELNPQVNSFMGQNLGQQGNRQTEIAPEHIYQLKTERIFKKEDNKVITTMVTASNQIIYNGKKTRIQKVYTFDQNENFFRFNVILKNLSNDTESLTFAPMLQLGYLVGPDLDLNDPYNPMKFGYFANEEYHDLAKEGGFFGDDPPPFTKKANQNIYWAGIHSRYFLLSVIPEKPWQELWADTKKDTPFHLGLQLDSRNVTSQKETVYSFFVYVGEKEKDIFADLGQTLMKRGYKWSNLGSSLKNTIDAHWTIEIVRDFLVKILVWLHIVFGNYGTALVVFAIITKLVFWPLNQKSANSMKKMSELSPQLKELKEKYKNDPTELNRRTMEIYKKNGVNPASGCLPILIQMPFFFALYSALSNSAILWNAPFIWWMQDLSQPDTVMVLPQFLGSINLNILPLIMVVTQFFQQKVTTSSADPMQQKMLLLMPLLFIFIFWQMPSGLVLYWTIQNILAIAQQLYTNHKGKKATK